MMNAFNDKKFFILSFALHLFFGGMISIVLLHSTQPIFHVAYYVPAYQGSLISSSLNKKNVKPLSHQKKFASTSFTRQSSALSQRTKLSKQDLDLQKMQDVKNKNLILTLLHEAIAAKQIYPEVALTLHQSGSVKIGFTLYQDKQIDNIHIVSTSGFKALDLAAMDAAKAASPLNAKDISLLSPTYFEVTVVFEEE